MPKVTQKNAAPASPITGWRRRAQELAEAAGTKDGMTDENASLAALLLAALGHRTFEQDNPGMAILGEALATMRVLTAAQASGVMSEEDERCFGGALEGVRLRIEAAHALLALGTPRSRGAE